MRSALTISMCLAGSVLVHSWKQQLLHHRETPHEGAQGWLQRSSQPAAAPVCPKAAKPPNLGLVLKGVQQQCSSTDVPPPAAQQHQHQQQQGRRAAPFVCAHGGASRAHPPNTAAAFEAALAAGADCVEVDASLTADLQLLAVHDRDLQRLMGSPAARVRNHTLQELQRLAWPSGEQLLTVAQAVQQVQGRVGLLIVDVKASEEPDKVLLAQGDGSRVTEAAALLRGLQALGLPRSCLVWAKSDSLVRQAQKAGIGGLTGYVVMRAPGTAFEDPLRMQDSQVAAVYHGLLDAPMVALLRGPRAAKQVFVWTVDAAGDVRRVLDLGVDGIVTNEPQRVLAAIAERGTCLPGGTAEE